MSEEMMDPQELRLRLDAIDKELVANSIPVKHRTFEACRMLAKDAARYPKGFKMFGEEYRVVKDYFEKRYGPNDILLPTFEVPYMIDGEIYYYRIPILINMTRKGMAAFDPLTKLKAPDAVKARLHSDQHAHRAFLDDFHSHLGTARIFGKRSTYPGIEDYREAIDNLRHERFNHAAWSVIQCAEKASKEFLKLVPLDDTQLRKLGHSLKRIHDRCVSFESACEDIAEEMALCHHDNVDFRYEQKAQFTRTQIYGRVRAAFSIWAHFSDLVNMREHNIIIQVDLVDGVFKKRYVGKDYELATPEEHIDFLRSEGHQALLGPDRTIIIDPSFEQGTGENPQNEKSEQ